MAALKSAQVATLVKDAEEKRAKVRARRRDVASPDGTDRFDVARSPPR